MSFFVHKNIKRHVFHFSTQESNHSLIYLLKTRGNIILSSYKLVRVLPAAPLNVHRFLMKCGRLNIPVCLALCLLCQEMRLNQDQRRVCQQKKTAGSVCAAGVWLELETRLNEPHCGQVSSQSLQTTVYLQWCGWQDVDWQLFGYMRDNLLLEVPAMLSPHCQHGCAVTIDVIHISSVVLWCFPVVEKVFFLSLLFSLSLLKQPTGHSSGTVHICSVCVYDWMEAWRWPGLV